MNQIRSSGVELCLIFPAGAEININIVVDIAVSRGMKHVVKFADVIEHSVIFKEFDSIFSVHISVPLIALKAEYGEIHFFAHCDDPP